MRQAKYVAQDSEAVLAVRGRAHRRHERSIAEAISGKDPLRLQSEDATSRERIIGSANACDTVSTKPPGTPARRNFSAQAARVSCPKAAAMAASSGAALATRPLMLANRGSPASSGSSSTSTASRWKKRSLAQQMNTSPSAAAKRSNGCAMTLPLPGRAGSVPSMR